MTFRRGLLAVALAASLSTAWAQQAQASQTIVIPVSQWTYANTSNVNGPTTDSYVAPGDPSPAATAVRVGNDTTGNIYRGFMRFSLTGVSGQILSVTLTGRVDHTWSCSYRSTSFYRTAPITVTPRQSWPGPALQQPLGVNSVQANETTCGQPNMSFELFNATITNDVQATVNAAAGAYYVGISARDLTTGANEAAQDRWMRYFLNDFKLQITFEPV